MASQQQQARTKYKFTEGTPQKYYAKLAADAEMKAAGAEAADSNAAGTDLPSSGGGNKYRYTTLDKCSATSRIALGTRHRKAWSDPGKQLSAAAKRIAIGSAVFTADCRLCLSTLEGPHDFGKCSLQIQYKRLDCKGFDRYSHLVLVKDVAELAAFRCTDDDTLELISDEYVSDFAALGCADDVAPGKYRRKYLVLRVNATMENGLDEYYASRTYRPSENLNALDSATAAADTRAGLPYNNFISIEMADDSTQVNDLLGLLCSELPNIGHKNICFFGVGMASTEKSHVAPDIGQVERCIGSFLEYDDGASGDSFVQMNAILPTRISIDGGLCPRGCYFSIGMENRILFLTISFPSENNVIIFAPSIISLHCFRAKLPKVRSRFYFVVRTYQAFDSGLSRTKDNDAFGVPIVIEVSTKSDYKMLRDNLDHPRLAAVVKDANYDPGWFYQLEVDLKCLVRDSCNEEDINNPPEGAILARPDDLDINTSATFSASTCFACRSHIPSIWSDEHVSLMPCCGSWTCFECYNDRVNARATDKVMILSVSHWAVFLASFNALVVAFDFPYYLLPFFVFA